MRPEVVAFRELNTLVRNLTDQLAGYRRRALAGEARVKELEESLERVNAELAVVRAGQGEVEARLATRPELDVAVGDVFPVVELADARDGRHAPSGEVVTPGPVAQRHGSDLEMVEENQRLRTRLGEARERTVMLVERVRFLRQQMSQGADR